MFIPTAVALAAAFWLAYLVALAVEKHLFDHALRLWNSLSRPKKCVASVLFVCVVAYAGTKPLTGGGDDGGDDPTGTNVVEIVEGDATNLVENIGGEASTNLVENGEAQSGEGEAAESQDGESLPPPLLMMGRPLASGSAMPPPTPPSPLSLDAVGRGETTDFTAPEGAVVATNWLMHGVTTGRVCVSTSDWDFPFGTNILRNFAAFADGRLEPWPGGNGINLAPLVAPLGIVPEANWTLLAPTNRPSLFWWTMRDNALVCTWQNVLLGREIDCPVSFQAELRATGGVTYRYDLGRLASDDLLTNAVIFAADNSAPLCLCVEKSLTSIAFRSTDEVACDECAASLASALGDSDPFACPPNSTNTVLEHAYYSGTTNGMIHLPESSPALAVLRVSVGGTGSGELLVGGRAVPLRAPAPRLFASAPPASAPNSQPSSLLLSVPRGETLPVYLRGDSTLSLSLDSDDFAFGVLPDLSGRHCRGWINFPYTEASHPCIHSLMANKTDVTLPVGEGADDLACTWNETDDVEVWNRPPRSARITGHFDPRYERPVTYTLSHPRYLFGQTEYEQNARYCPKPSDDDPTDYLGVGIPFPDECWCCHWQTCDTNCTCGCSHCGGWTVSLTNDYDFARTNYPHMGGVLKIRTPREYSASVALSVPAGMRRCCPCPEHWTNGVSLVYARRVSVVGPSGSEFRSSGDPVTVRIAATEPSYDPGDGRALFATNGAFSLSCDYTCLGVGISAYDIDLPALNAKNRQFGLPVVINTNLDEAVEIRLDVNVLLRGGRIRLSVEDASAPLEVWGYDYVRRERVKLADADNALDVTMAEWRRMTGHADDSGVPTTYVQLLVPRTGQATLVLHYWNVVDGKRFVEDEARQVVTAINPPLLPDYNRDGAINAQDVTNWLGGAVFRYWTNQCKIDGDVWSEPSLFERIADAVVGAENSSDDHVNGNFDLLNLFPVAIDVGAFVSSWGNAARFIVEPISGRFNYTLANKNWSEAGKIRTEPCTTLTGESLCNAAMNVMTNSGVQIDSALFSLGERSALLVAEARARSYGMRLRVILDGRTVLQFRLPMNITPVDEMFRFVSLRGAHDNEIYDFSGYGPAPSAGTDAELQNKDVFFVHGFNVSESGAREWNREIFKRLWVSGSMARYWGVTWSGDYHVASEAFNGIHYHRDVRQALLAAPSFARLVNARGHNAVVVGHSLGNMVVSEALLRGCNATKYFMLDAAVASEAYRGNLQARESTNPNYNRYVPEDWRGYNPGSWAANWYSWFTNDVQDARGQLGWNGHFSSLLTKPGLEVFNYYSTGDEVFEENNTTPGLATGVFHWPTLNLEWPFVHLNLELDAYPWQKQEVFKGVSALGSLSAGWGFHVWRQGDNRVRYSAAGANQLVASGAIVTNAVFNRDVEGMFQPTISDFDKADILASHIPAVSSPAGKVDALPGGNVRNYDLNTVEYQGSVWGRNTDVSTETRWLHSDIKNMAYFYVYRFYNDLLNKGQMK